MIVLECFIVATILCGFLEMVYKRNLVIKTMDMDVISTGVIVYYVLITSRDGLFTPILSESHTEGYADPIPQAVILAAIVISFSIQALMLEEVMKLASDNPILKIKQIERGINK